MLYELAKMFSGKEAERRGHPRKAEKYPVRWVKDLENNVFVDGVGIEISPTGALFVLKEKPPGQEFTVVIQLGERQVRARVTVNRHDAVNQGGATWHRFATKFGGIAADDWDAIVRYVNNAAEPPESKAAEELKAVVQKADDAFRLLPLAVQKQIVDTLVETNRLFPPPEGQAPLLRMTYSGHSKKSDGQEVHTCHVHSRITVDGEIRQYETTFLVDSSGKVQVKSSR